MIELKKGTEHLNEAYMLAPTARRNQGLWHQISRGERSIGRDLARVPEVRTAVDGRESRHAAFRASATPRSASVENGRLRGGESTAYRKNRDSARFTGVSER